MALADPPASGGPVDLDADAASMLRVAGGVDDLTSGAMADAGDFNDDGRDDLVLGSVNYDTQRGHAHVVYGSAAADPLDVELTELTDTQDDRGWVFEGAPNAGSTQNTGQTVAGLGDQNGDGIDDVAISAPRNFHEHTGNVHVIYGASSADPDDLAAPDLAGAGAARGFSISGTGAPGFDLENAGDFNGDGIDDILIGAPNPGSSGAYVVYGSSAADPADLSLPDLGAAQGARGMRLLGTLVGAQVAGIGDINGDDLDDVAVSVSNGFVVEAHVIYGSATADPTDVTLANLTTSESTRGFVISGGVGVGAPGPAGDFNKDGIDDLALTGSARVNVIYGRQQADIPDIQIANLEEAEVRTISSTGSFNPFDARLAGDVNGDGIDDVAVRATGPAALRGYVVYGSAQADAPDVDVDDIDTSKTGGFSVRRAGLLDLALAAGAPDMNADGRPDVVFGTRLSSQPNRGEAFAIYGFTMPPTTPPAAPPSPEPPAGAAISRSDLLLTLIRSKAKGSRGTRVRLGARLRLRKAAPAGHEVSLCATLAGRTRRGRARRFTLGSCSLGDSRSLKPIRVARSFRCAGLRRLRRRSLTGRVRVFDSTGSEVVDFSVRSRRKAGIGPPCKK